MGAWELLVFKAKKGFPEKPETLVQRTGRDERIRTSGPLNPIQVRYQTALHPDPKLEIRSAESMQLFTGAIAEKPKTTGL